MRGGGREEARVEAADVQKARTTGRWKEPSCLLKEGIMVIRQKVWASWRRELS